MLHVARWTLTPASGVPQTGLTLGSFNADYPTRQSRNEREVQRYVIGAQGKFGLLGTDWRWDGCIPSA